MAEKYHVPLLIAAAFALFFIRLGYVDIMPPDEPRYAQVSREMLVSGNFLSPTLNGEPYKEKPPMLFWLSAGLGAVSGDVGPWAARLPSALSGLATVLLVYMLGSSMFGSKTGLFAAFVLMTTVRFWWESRVGQIDMLLTAFVTAAIFSLWRWHTQRRRRDLFWVYAMLAAGMLTKGPPALIFPMLLGLAFYWGQPESRRALRLPWGLLFIVATFLLWLIPARLAANGLHAASGSEASASGEFFKQTVGRLLLGVSKAEWPWFYVEHLIVDLLPWTLLLPWVIPALWRARKRDDAMRFLWAWFLPAFVFFTISVAKRETYILPLYPCMAIMIAAGAREALESMGAAWQKRVTLFWGAALFAAALTPWFVIDNPLATLGVGPAVLWCGVVLLCGLDALRRAANGRLGNLGWMLAAHGVAVLLVGAPTLLPALNAKHSVREFCAPIAAASAEGKDFDLYSLALFREELRYHCDHPQKVVLMEPLETPGADTLRGLKAQADLRTKLRKETGDLRLESWPEPSLADTKKLYDAVLAVEAGSGDPVEAEQLLTALRAELARFRVAFGASRPALCLVEERDWRWLCAVDPELQDLSILDIRDLPGRRLFLLANALGGQLLN